MAFEDKIGCFKNHLVSNIHISQTEIRNLVFVSLQNVIEFGLNVDVDFAFDNFFNQNELKNSFSKGNELSILRQMDGDVFQLSRIINPIIIKIVEWEPCESE